MRRQIEEANRRGEARDYLISAVEILTMDGETITRDDPFGIQAYNENSERNAVALGKIIDDAKQVSKAGLTDFDSHVATLVTSQAAEIRRLQGIIRDATQVPVRHPISICTMGDRGAVALANDFSIWFISTPYGDDWKQLAQLPQSSDEI